MRTKCDPVPPSERAKALARAALRDLEPLVARRRPVVKLRPVGAGSDHEVAVPLEAFELFVDLLGEMAEGNAVAVVAYDAELTTQEAADILNVSRPYLIRLLEQGTIPHRKVGTHRRVAMTDLVAFKRRDDEERRRVVDELARDADEGFDP